MDKETIAILLSTLSLAIAALALGWNIYRDVFLKAKVKINFSKSLLVGGGLPQPIAHTVISATNHGPGRVTLHSLVMKNAPLWRRFIHKVEFAMIVHDYTNRMSSQLPAKLEVGEKVDFLLNWDVDSFLKAKCTHVGISDSFGRIHWAPTNHVSKTRKKWHEEFSTQAP